MSNDLTAGANSPGGTPPRLTDPGESATPHSWTDATDPAELEAIAVEVAIAAADLVRGRLGQTQIVDTKTTPTDVVTAADVEAEAFIRDALQAATPGAAILGEEGAPVSGSTSVGWIVDPIDGTVNFLYNLPVMSVSIGATVAGEVVAGAVVDIVRGEVFRGSVGNGVLRDNVRVMPSATTNIGDALVGTGFSYAAEERRREGTVVARVLPEVRDIRNFGSAALHLCWVACGRLEAFYQVGPKEWDVAAGALLVSEAGGRVELGSDANGGLVLAATSGVFDTLRNLIVE